MGNGSCNIKDFGTLLSFSPHPNISDGKFQYDSSFYSHPNIADTFLERK